MRDNVIGPTIGDDYVKPVGTDVVVANTPVQPVTGKLVELRRDDRINDRNTTARVIIVNTQTVISYGLPYPSPATIDIYDILGRKMSTLIDTHQEAGFYYKIWNADKFSSGLYFYKLQAGVNTETKKMILLK